MNITKNQFILYSLAWFGLAVWFIKRAEKKCKENI